MRYFLFTTVIFLLSLSNVLAQGYTVDVSKYIRYYYGRGDTVVISGEREKGFGAAGDLIHHSINYDNCTYDLEFKGNGSFKVQGANVVSVVFVESFPFYNYGYHNQYGSFPSDPVITAVVKEPTTYTVSWESTSSFDATKCGSADEKTTFIGTITLKPHASTPQIFQISHFHQLSANPDFSTRRLLAAIPSSNSSSFKVCADGSSASIFKFSGGDYDYKQATLSLPDDTTKFGRYSIIARNSDSLVVRYKHPSRIEPGSPSYTFTGTLNVPDRQPYPFTIEIRRTPVVMVHGLWSDKESFQAFEEKLLERSLYTPDYLKRVDYSQTNNLHFSSNIIEVPQAISQVIASLRDNNTAAGAADVIGHSMGGILSRLYLQSTTYRFDIHKLITVNTPHSGSQIANFLLDITNQAANDAFCGATFRRLLSNNTLCNAGAIDDLRVNSSAIDSDLNGASLNRNKVPSHAITTAEYADADEIGNTMSLKDKTFSIKWVLDAYGSYRTSLIFYPETENDQIVSLLSQKGGLVGPCTSYVSNQPHAGSPANIQVMPILRTLLDADAQGSSFCLGFDPYPIDYNPQRNPPGFSGVTQVDGPTTLTIKTPIKGSYYSRGSTVAITASGSGVSEIRTIVRYNYDSIYVAKNTGSSVSYTVPVGSYVGRREVIVLGKTASGQSISDTSYFFVQYNLCQSIKTGDWEDSTTWTCGHPPTVNDWVIIGQPHTVTINSSNAIVRKVIYEQGGKIRFASPSSKVRFFVPGYY